MLPMSAWLGWLLAAAMFAVTAYHLAHGARHWWGPDRALPADDVWHAAMGAGMGLMGLGATHHGSGWWALGFAIPVAVMAWRALDRYVVAGVAAAGHDLRRAVAGLAMCWMLGAPMAMAMPAGSAVSGAGDGALGAAVAAHRHPMAGMASGSVGSGIDPAVLALLVRSVTALMLLAVVVLAARSCWLLLRPPSLVRPGREPTGGRSSAATSRRGCQLAMHVTAGVMLVAMM